MPELVKRQNIARSFGSASSSYDISARLQRYSGKKLLSIMPMGKQKVVDLGCGTGFFTDIIASEYPKVYGVDLAKNMLDFAKQRTEQTIQWINADAFQIPMLDNSVDIVFSNLMFQWCDPLSVAINESLRILKPGGVLIFSTLVEGTLEELRQSWKQVDNDKHVIDFKTKKEINTALEQTNSAIVEDFIDEVVLEYENVLHLAHELKGLGANYVPEKINKGLAGKTKWQKMCNAYQKYLTEQGAIPATYRLYSVKLVKLHD